MVRRDAIAKHVQRGRVGVATHLSYLCDTGIDSGSDNPDATTSYAYDANDRLLSEIKDVSGGSAGDTNTLYDYDATDQTGKTVRTGTVVGSGTLVEQHQFGYDATGRLAQATVTRLSQDLSWLNQKINNLSSESYVNIFWDPADGDPFGFAFEYGVGNAGSFTYANSYYWQL